MHTDAKTGLRDTAKARLCSLRCHRQWRRFSQYGRGADVRLAVAFALRVNSDVALREVFVCIDASGMLVAMFTSGILTATGTVAVGVDGVSTEVRDSDELRRDGRSTYTIRGATGALAAASGAA